MRVKDASEWQAQLAEFAADPDPKAEAFRDFVIAWAEAAENMVASSTRKQLMLESPIEALRASLRTVETRMGRWPVGFIGQALLVLCTFWEPAGDPKDFYASLSIIEQNLFMDVYAVKQEALNAEAQEAQP